MVIMGKCFPLRNNICIYNSNKNKTVRILCTYIGHYSLWYSMLVTFSFESRVSNIFRRPISSGIFIFTRTGSRRKNALSDIVHYLLRNFRRQDNYVYI